MKIIAALLILVLGFVVDFIGAWMKVTHQAPADITLVISTFLKVVGLISFTFFLLAHPKVKEFLHYDEFKDSFK